MTFGPGRSGVVLFNWNTWKSLHCVCGSVALLSCVMGQFICVWQGQYLGIWMGMKGLMSLHVAVWGKLDVVSEDGTREGYTHLPTCTCIWWTMSQSQAVWGWCLTSGDRSTCVAIVLECCYQPSLGWMFRCVTCIAVLLFCFRCALYRYLAAA